MTSVTAALADFRRSASPWLALPFFAGGDADSVAARVNARMKAGARVLPEAKDIFNALAATPLDAVKVVILGQDPYPTPGDANGFAFSYVGRRRLPASLKVILSELPGPHPSGDLTPWASRGALLLNAALTVEAGKAGAHLRIGWSALADQVVTAVSDRAQPAVFLLWGAQARARGALIDRARHGVIESGHPSPLNRRRDFQGTRPFQQANAWLEGEGLAPIDWTLP